MNPMTQVQRIQLRVGGGCVAGDCTGAREPVAGGAGDFASGSVGGGSVGGAGLGSTPMVQRSLNLCWTAETSAESGMAPFISLRPSTRFAVDGNPCFI